MTLHIITHGLTRMHSSTMRTARSSSRPEGVSTMHPPPDQAPPGPGTPPGPGIPLDQIPPRLPPWLLAWTRPPSISPFSVGLDQIPLHFPLGCGPGHPPPETCCKACWNPSCNACWDSTPLWTDTHL